MTTKEAIRNWFSLTNESLKTESIMVKIQRRESLTSYHYAFMHYDKKRITELRPKRIKGEMKHRLLILSKL